jgi:hypothetical protein
MELEASSTFFLEYLKGYSTNSTFLWSSTCSTNSTVELLHGGVRGAELEKREQSSPKHALKIIFCPD